MKKTLLIKIVLKNISEPKRTKTRSSQLNELKSK